MNEIITINPISELQSTPWIIPPSKSWTYRQIISAFITQTSVTIQNALISSDILLLLKSLEVHYEIHNDSLSITPSPIDNKIIDVGNSGLALRLIIGLAARLSSPVTITGDLSIQTLRKVAPMIDILRSGGVRVSYLQKDGYAPLTVTGPFRGGQFSMDVTDSQYLSGIMIASISCASTIELLSINELPWILLSIEWLTSLGANIVLKDATLTIAPSELSTSTNINIPGDWSSAAFPIAAHLMTQSYGEIINLSWPSSQGDSEIANWLVSHNLGNWDSGILKITPRGYKGASLNLNTWIDALPIMSVILSQATSPSHLEGLASSEFKECNRPVEVCKLLNSFGVKAQYADKLSIMPGALIGTSLELPHDHRMTLSAICAALCAQGPSKISPISAADKTYPKFLDELTKRGARIQ